MELRTVFGDVMQVVAADNNSASHLGGDNTPGEDPSTDGNLTGEWTLFICFHSHRLWAIRKRRKERTYRCKSRLSLQGAS
jgi:hypothetical protein